MLGLGTQMLCDNTRESLFDKYKSERAVRFDGVDQYGELSDGGETFWDAASNANGGTISMWFRSSDVYPATSGQSNYLMGSYYLVFPTGNFGYISFKNDGGTNRVVLNRTDLDFGSGTSTIWVDSQSTGAVNLADDTWHHLVFIMVPYLTKWRSYLYINGSNIPLTANSVVNAPNTSYPGASGMLMTVSRYNTYYGAFDIDEIAMWDKELTSSEISYIYNQGVQGFGFDQNFGNYNSASNLYSWYKMGDSPDWSNELSPDSSGNGRDMTLYNAPEKILNS